ncbi:MAG: hypothetical protein JNM19_09310 [Chitinophagaceae bacterium]|nr:hypothetical protein [Chitinophagaceae bacterium]
MTDKLKQFIEDHRTEFDTEEPNSQLYKKIATVVPHQKKAHYLLSHKWKIAAAAVVLVLLSLSVYILINSKNRSQDTASIPAPVLKDDLNEITDPVYAKQIYQFRELIGLQQTELKQLEKEYPQLYQQFVTDMNELDSSYQALKLKLPANPNREILLEAMIQNLQLQSELLNRQLLIIKEIKQNKKSKSHETSII